MFRWCALILVLLLSLDSPVNARVRTTADAIIVEGNLQSSSRPFFCVIIMSFNLKMHKRKKKTRIFFDEKSYLLAKLIELSVRSPAHEGKKHAGHFALCYRRDDGSTGCVE